MQGWLDKRGPTEAALWKKAWCVLRKGDKVADPFIFEWFTDEACTRRKGNAKVTSETKLISVVSGAAPVEAAAHREKSFAFLLDEDPQAGEDRRLLFFDAKTADGFEAWSRGFRIATSEDGLDPKRRRSRSASQFLDPQVVVQAAQKAAEEKAAKEAAANKVAEEKELENTKTEVYQLLSGTAQDGRLSAVLANNSYPGGVKVVKEEARELFKAGVLSGRLDEVVQEIAPQAAKADTIEVLRLKAKDHLTALAQSGGLQAELPKQAEAAKADSLEAFRLKAKEQLTALSQSGALRAKLSKQAEAPNAVMEAVRLKAKADLIQLHKSEGLLQTLSREAYKLTVDFKPGSTGLSTDKSGQVETVDERKQAYLLGVRVGMRYLTIAGEPYTRARYFAARKGAASYEVTFEKAAKAAVEDLRFKAEEGVGKACDSSRLPTTFKTEDVRVEARELLKNGKLNEKLDAGAPEIIPQAAKYTPEQMSAADRIQALERGRALRLGKQAVKEEARELVKAGVLSGRLDEVVQEIATQALKEETRELVKAAVLSGRLEEIVQEIATQDVRVEARELLKNGKLNEKLDAGVPEIIPQATHGHWPSSPSGAAPRNASGKFRRFVKPQAPFSVQGLVDLSANDLLRSAIERQQQLCHRTRTKTNSNLSEIILKLQGNQATQRPKCHDAFQDLQRQQQAVQHREWSLAALDYASRLAECMFADGFLEEAEELFAEVLAGRRCCLGDCDRATWDSCNNLAVVMKDIASKETTDPVQQEKARSRLQEAHSLLVEAVEGSRTYLGSTDRDTLEAISNLAALLSARGNKQVAEAYYAEALEGYKSSLGHEHGVTLRTMDRLALVWRSVGKLQEAECLCEEALQIRRTTLGESHQETQAAIRRVESLKARRRGHLS